MPDYPVFIVLNNGLFEFELRDIFVFRLIIVLKSIIYFSYRFPLLV